EQNGDRIFDLHLWRVGPGHVAGIVSLVSTQPQVPSVYKKRLADLRSLAHITIEAEAWKGWSATEAEEGVAVGIEQVGGRRRKHVGALHHLKPAECRHQHEQGRARQMKIGHHHVDRAEAIARRNE